MMWSLSAMKAELSSAIRQRSHEIQAGSSPNSLKAVGELPVSTKSLNLSIFVFEVVIERLGYLPKANEYR